MERRRLAAVPRARRVTKRRRVYEEYDMICVSALRVGTHARASPTEAVIVAEIVWANRKVTEEPVSYLNDGAKEELYASDVWAAFRATKEYYDFMAGGLLLPTWAPPPAAVKQPNEVKGEEEK
jgi:hypothetical protein